MRNEKLETMLKGWFVGNFSPTVYQTNAVEVAIKSYQAGNCEDWHYHKIATEITVVITGEIEMNKQKFTAGDIVIIEPGEGTNFRAITDTTNLVVKIPGANNDKYIK